MHAVLRNTLIAAAIAALGAASFSAAAEGRERHRSGSYDSSRFGEGTFEQRTESGFERSVTITGPDGQTRTHSGSVTFDPPKP